MIGGQQNYMLARCKAAPDDLTVIAADCPGSKRFDAQQDFEIYRFHYPWHTPKWGPLRRALQLWCTTCVLNKVLMQNDYDIVELATVLPGGIAAYLPFHHDFYLVSFAYDEDLLHPPDRWYIAPLFYQTLKRINLFIAITQFTKEILMGMDVPSEKVAVINPPIDQDRFRTLGNGSALKTKLPTHTLILLTISRLVPKKGIDRIIELMPRLTKRFPGLLYVVGGEGEDAPRLERLAIQYGVADKVIFLGSLTNEELIDVYAAGDVFVMPSHPRPKHKEPEGFGIVFLEAGSQKLPVIGSDQGGCSEAILNGVTGYLVEPDNIYELENCIVQLLNNPHLRQKLGKAGRKWALESRDWTPLLDIDLSSRTLSAK
jgi:phosphatidyl-myo-inositol dimannoside synthase